MRIEELYTPEILALATAIPHIGRLPRADGAARLRSRTCGSRIGMELRLDATGRIAEFAQQVEACALAQASACLLGRHIVGALPAEVFAARDRLRRMLREGAAPPRGRWADLALLAPVREVPARHESVLLPFEAACRALAEAGHDGE